MVTICLFFFCFGLLIFGYMSTSLFFLNYIDCLCNSMLTLIILQYVCLITVYIACSHKISRLMTTTTASKRRSDGSPLDKVTDLRPNMSNLWSILLVGKLSIKTILRPVYRTLVPLLCIQIAIAWKQLKAILSFSYKNAIEA